MLIGRNQEKEILLKMLESEQSEFVAVYGRRRVGKTYLIRETFDYKFAFQHTGILDAPMSEHTTFKIGGAADILIFPSSSEEVSEVLKLVNEFKMPVFLLGNGSNVLVRDKGIRGAVIKFSGEFFGK